MQDKFPLFSASIGDRIRWIRQKQGLTLSDLADGRASTAGSWEEGKLPRSDKWQGIAERLRVSWNLISTGWPRSEEDYVFLRENRNQIDFNEASPDLVNVLANLIVSKETSPLGAAEKLTGSLSVEEDPAPYGTPESLKREITRALDASLRAAGDDANRLGWLLEQTKAHLTPPAHWVTKKPNPWAVRPAPPEQQNPRQAGSGEGSGQASA